MRLLGHEQCGAVNKNVQGVAAGNDHDPVCVAGSRGWHQQLQHKAQADALDHAAPRQLCARLTRVDSCTLVQV